ncbi:hypothetical protein [Streptomyces griseorubiginosus]|uniref:hypothetical protein n=1 Tax=Streptomyces griseorubiginosus TaxID=67304 RepID=UPI0036AE00EC
MVDDQPVDQVGAVVGTVTVVEVAFPGVRVGSAQARTARSPSGEPVSAGEDSAEVDVGADELRFPVEGGDRFEPLLHEGTDRVGFSGAQLVA